MQSLKRHAVYWMFIYLLWAYLKAYGSFQWGYMAISLVYVMIHMMVYYTLKEFQIPRYYNQGKTGLFVCSLLISSLGFLLLWHFGMVAVLSIIQGQLAKPYMSVGGYLLEVVQFYSPAVALLAWESYRERERELERIEELEQEKMRTEIKFLKAQLNPHFLFNTLRNLHVNVIDKSPEAPDMIMRLSGILDYVLYKSQNKIVVLREELEAIEHFLKLEQIRCQNQLAVHFEKTENKEILISPLVLLSLVEHVFKFENFKNANRPKIEIEVTNTNEAIRCILLYSKSNKQKEEEKAKKEEEGWSTIKRRLELSYPEKHKLQVEDEETMRKIILELTRG